MNLIDVNVLVYAHREESDRHAEYRKWLEAEMGDPAGFGMVELVLSGFLRIVTHPRIFSPPTPLARALEFVRTLRDHPNCRVITPGSRHWAIFMDLCEKTECKGNLIPDAYLGALAIEQGCDWITTDRGFARFPRLKWRHPVL